MTREKAAMLTQAEHPKTRFRAVFVSLHGEATAMGADALADGALDAEERADLGPLLDDLISAAVAFRALVRSGGHGG